MNFFRAKELAEALSVLTHIEAQLTMIAGLAQTSNAPCPAIAEEHLKAVNLALDGIFNYCSDGAVPQKIQASLSFLKGAVLPNSSAVATELRNIREAVDYELGRRLFIRVSPERNHCLEQFSKESLLGPEVPTNFPSAVPDIREAGNCLAAECNTAAVFHLMRVVEWGLRALCADLGFSRVKSKIKKSGRVVYTPIEYSEWERILDELQERVDRKIVRIKRGPSKQTQQQFYYPALQDIRGIRDAWRNHVMHTRDEYNHEDADAILSHVKRLMSTLATRVTEV